MAVCTRSPSTPILTTQSGSRRSGPFLPDPGGMTLRVRGPGKEDQIVRIRSPKCTVGSAAGCTLRVRAAGVGPLHCWILRGTHRAIVRRLHGPATLNGGQFDEAVLKTGDRLRIGSVELEIVECSQPLPSAAPAAAPGAPLSTETLELKSKLEEAREQVTRLEGESRQAFESSIVAAERANQLRDALAAAHEQLADTCDELAAAQETIARQSDQLGDTQRQLGDCQQQLETLRASQATSSTLVEQVRTDAAAATQRCAALEAELAGMRATAATERDGWKGERAQLERRLVQREAEVEALRSSAAVQTGAMTVALGEPSVNHEDVQAESQARLADLEQCLSAKQGEIESLQKLIDQHATVQHRLERLTREYDDKCGELEEARRQAAAAAESNAAGASELEERTQALTRWQAELAQRETAFAESLQQHAQEREAIRVQSLQVAADREQLSQEREASLAQSQQVAADREQLAAEQSQLVQQRDQLCAEQEQLAIARQGLAESQYNHQVLSEQEAQLNERAIKLETQLAAATARLTDLDELRERLVDARAALEERREQLEQRQQAIEVRAQQIEARAQELDSRADEVQAQRNELDEQVAVLASRPVASPNDPRLLSSLQATEEPVEAITGQEAEAVSVGEAPPAVAQEPLQEQPADNVQEDPSDPASVNSVLSRLVKAGLWRGNEPGDEGSSGGAPARSDDNCPRETVCVPASEPPEVERGAMPMPARPSAAVSHEEESIESYMDRLMKRVRGDSEVAVNSSEPAPAADSDSVAPVAVAAPSSEAPSSEAPSPVEPAQQEPEAYSPRRTAPELGSDMSAMRALANSAARSAIDQHVRKHTGKQVSGKLFGACITVVASLVLSFWAWKANSLQAAAGAAIGGSLGAYWTLAALRRLFSLMRLNKLQAESTDPPASPAA